MNYYVYLYRDKSGKPRYVGYGKDAIRATSHESGSHNEELTRFLKDSAYTLEIAGPFESEEVGRAVETALISALQPLFNRDPGQTKWRFRPLGVPEGFADRLVLPPLTRRELVQSADGASQAVLLVKIGDKNFEDGRGGYDPSNPPADDDILNRMNKWWQIGRYIDQWDKTPSQSPAVLIGVNGKPGSQIVIGSVFINQGQWKEAIRDGSLVEVPTAGPLNLDALELRGRRLAPEAGIRFGGITSKFFLILEAPQE